MLEAIQRTPSVVRSLVRRMPERWQPRPDPAIGVVALDGTGRTVHRLTGPWRASPCSPASGRPAGPSGWAT